MPELPPEIATPADVRVLMDELHAYGRWFADMAIRQKAGAHATKPAPDLSQPALVLIRSAGSEQLLTSAAIDSLVANLQKTADHAPHITITLADPAPPEVRKELTAACRAHIAGDALVSFRFNRTILGGMVVQCGSRVYDWSFKHTLATARTGFSKRLGNV